MSFELVLTTGNGTLKILDMSVEGVIEKLSDMVPFYDGSLSEHSCKIRCFKYGQINYHPSATDRAFSYERKEWGGIAVITTTNDDSFQRLLHSSHRLKAIANFQGECIVTNIHQFQGKYNFYTIAQFTGLGEPSTNEP